ncbi:MAG: biopolymer transporter ExbD [Myxococcota bacterium]
MGMSVGDKKGGPIGDINVTPLVDVVLVLLIIFMVVTPMLTSGVDVKLPDAKTTTSAQDLGQHLVVSIKKDGTIYVETNPTSDEKVVDDVMAALSSNPSRSLLIKGDKGLKWGDVHKVMFDIHNARGSGTMLLAAEKIQGE